MEATAIIASGDWMIIGGLDNWHQRKETRGIFGLHQTIDDGLTDVIIMLQAKRIFDDQIPEKGKKNEGGRLGSGSSRVPSYKHPRSTQRYDANN